MLDLQTRQNNNFIHGDELTCARTHTHTNTQLHSLLSTINIYFAQIFDFFCIDLMEYGITIILSERGKCISLNDSDTYLFWY